MIALLRRLQRATDTTRSEAIVLAMLALVVTAGYVGPSVWTPEPLHAVEAADRIARMLDSIAAVVRYDSAGQAIDPVPDRSTGFRRASARRNSPPRQIHLSTATAEQLQALPGIGPSTARAIIARREQRPFRSVDDLLDVRGIGPAKLANMRPYILGP